MGMSIEQITVKCERVIDHGNGTFSLIYPARNMTDEELRLVQSMIPDRLDGFYKLMQQQMLLDNIATEADIAKDRDPETGAVKHPKSGVLKKVAKVDPTAERIERGDLPNR